jgi:hypothetical protein
MNQERHYKLAEGWTLTVTQYSINVKHQISATSSKSIGCGRLPERPKKGSLADITCSMSGKHFYLNGFAGPSGSWMGFKTYDSPEALKAECKAGFAGHSLAGFRSAGGQEYCREILEFSLWSVKSQPVAQLLLDDSPEAEAAMDYVSMVFHNHQESVARFDDNIKGSGWTYASIMEAVGPWVPVPELPVVDLSDRKPQG